MSERNAGRAARAGRVIAGYGRAREDVAVGRDVAAQREGLVDLLTDLRHWCRYAGVDFGAAGRMADIHHTAEVVGPIREVSR